MILRDIKVTKEELDYMKKARDNFGTESYIYRVDEKTAYKIFRTSSFEVLENKFQKLMILSRKNIDFMINPLATLSCCGSLAGYKMIYLEKCEWCRFLVNFYYLKDLKDKLGILENYYGILYGDVVAENLFIYNGKLLLGDCDNTQVDGYSMNIIPVVASNFYKNDRFTVDVHALMHNIFTLQELENTFITNLSKLENINTHSFDEKGKQLIKDMSKAYQNPGIIKNRYLIDNLK